MSYKLSSWDVGIKNLAYSVLSRNDNGDIEVGIINKINILSDYDHFCKHLLKKRNKKDTVDRICGKKATYCGPIMNSDNIIYYCGTHKKNYNPLEDGWEDTYIKPIKNTDKTCTIQASLDPRIEGTCSFNCTYILPKKKVICNKKAHSKCNDSGAVAGYEYYCNAHKKIIIKKRKQKYSIKKMKKQTCSSIKLNILCKKMYEKLDEIIDDVLIGMDEIVIENQPVFINPKMKTIAAFLYSWFVLRGCIDKRNHNVKVNFVSASNKLKINKDKSIKIIKNAKNDKEKYKLTKDLAIEYGELIVGKERAKILKESHKKLDDIYDAMLLGYYHISKNKNKKQNILTLN